MTWLLVLPFLLPLIAAAWCVLARTSLTAQRIISLTTSFIHLAAAAALLAWVRGEGIQVLQLGAWPAPFGISLVADLLACLMVLVSALMGACVNVYAVGSLGREREAAGFHPLYHVLLAGISGSFLTGDIFNLFVLFEVMLIASFALAAAGGGRRQTGGAVKYVTFNLLASFLFLMAVGLLYRNSGTLNMAALSLALNGEDPGFATVLSILFLIAFGIKAAAFPLFFWLPDSYPHLPVAISAIFAGLLTKVGVYALLRVFTLLFVQDPEFTHGLILAIAGFTMLTGVLGAAYHKEVRKILSFHIISQVGYMLMGLGLFSLLGLAGGIFYVFHHIIVKTNLFLVSGLVNRLEGSFRLAELGGVLARSPFTAVLFLIPALSLAGFPPLSGFVAKFILIKASLDAGHYIVAAVALVVGLLTIFSMTKIWNEAFLKPSPRDASPDAGERGPFSPPSPASAPSRRDYLLLWGPCLLLASITVVIGIWAEPFFNLSRDAAAQLLDRGGYVRAVLGRE